MILSKLQIMMLTNTRRRNPRRACRKGAIVPLPPPPPPPPKVSSPEILSQQPPPPDKTEFTEAEFEQLFAIIPNNANGNCFFESMEYLLNQKGAGLGPTSNTIRKMVGDFYRDFDMDIDYPMNTIEYNIKIGIMFDNMDGVEEVGSGGLSLDDMPIPHIYNVAHNYVWASMTDVLVCALMFEVNIDLYKKCYGDGDGYILEKIRSQYNWTDTITLYYNGVNHFEALYSL